MKMFQVSVLFFLIVHCRQTGRIIDLFRDCERECYKTDGCFSFRIVSKPPMSCSSTPIKDNAGPMVEKKHTDTCFIEILLNKTPCYGPPFDIRTCVKRKPGKFIIDKGVHVMIAVQNSNSSSPLLLIDMKRQTETKYISLVGVTAICYIRALKTFVIGTGSSIVQWSLASRKLHLVKKMQHEYIDVDYSIHSIFMLVKTGGSRRKRSKLMSVSIRLKNKQLIFQYGQHVTDLVLEINQKRAYVKNVNIIYYVSYNKTDSHSSLLILVQSIKVNFQITDFTVNPSNNDIYFAHGDRVYKFEAKNLKSKEKALRLLKIQTFRMKFYESNIYIISKENKLCRVSPQNGFTRGKPISLNGTNMNIFDVVPI